MQNPRIIAGSAKGRKLEVPDSARPMTDRIKQSVFDILADHLQGAQVLDLFAGSGNLGIEALSRGAERAVFLEADPFSADIITQNITRLGFRDQAQVISRKAETFLHHTEDQFDLIFADPPFVAADKFDLTLLTSVMAPEAVIAFRAPTTTDITIPPQLKLLYSQNYGESTLYFLAGQ